MNVVLTNVVSKSNNTIQLLFYFVIKYYEEKLSRMLVTNYL